jgi:hypothetical protein
MLCFQTAAQKARTFHVHFITNMTNWTAITSKPKARHRFRVEQNGSVSAINPGGERMTFRDWQTFSNFDPTARRPR